MTNPDEILSDFVCDKSRRLHFSIYNYTNINNQITIINFRKVFYI